MPQVLRCISWTIIDYKCLPLRLRPGIQSTTSSNTNSIANQSDNLYISTDFDPGNNDTNLSHLRHGFSIGLQRGIHSKHGWSA